MAGRGGGFDTDVNFQWDEGSFDDDYYDDVPTTRNDRYGNAYGNYSGGYRPSRNFDGPGRFGGPPMFRPRFPIIGPVPPPPPPPFMGTDDWNMMGRGYGPDGPPNRRTLLDDRAIRYLMRCGVPKEQCRNLPRQVTHLIQPEHCGVCGMSFNAFSMSRSHYTSKNHLKNQNKLLSHGRPSSMENPLKSRDLYCELCDVQITSKVHAESHYSGKSHRSIVEGRKPPKNPYLQQRNKEDRVKQLIRREKKHLKHVEEKVVEAVTEDPKPFDPDLYCNICKTTVTCSEQMTAHLNGKRHLTKEKRHILEMMESGGAAADDKNCSSNQNEVAIIVEDEEEDDGNKATGEKDGNGTAPADEWKAAGPDETVEEW